MNAKMTLILIALLSTLPQLGFAATWTVEKDGSGDFTIIQDALDAASPGDTILIGPGRYDTLHSKRFLLDGVLASAVMWFRKPDLTVVGSGPGSTIIGPSTYVGEHEGGYTASVVIDAGAPATLRNVGMENTRYEFHVLAPSTIEGCRIERVDARSGTFAAWIGHNSGSTIRGCELINTGGLTTIHGVTNLVIEDCSFEEFGELESIAVYLGNGAQDCVVRRCDFAGGASGVYASGRAEVEDCTFTEVRVVGIEGGGGHIVARRCHVGVTRMGARIVGGLLELYDSVLEGGTQFTILSSGNIFARGSHVLNVGAPTVRSIASAGSGRLVDLRYNWWGTADPAQIEAWIEDDDGTVLWQPPNDMPIPTESESMSRLKGKFSGL